MTAVPQELAEAGIEQVRVVRLEPGDIILLSTSRRLSQADVDAIRERAQEFFDTHRVAVLEDGMTLSVVREGGEL